VRNRNNCVKKDMIVRLEKIQIQYLKNKLSIDREDLFNSLGNISEIENVTLNITEDIADEIREWASDRLQLVGFDMNYELTEEGRVLEQLIDLFFS
jgi:hypothetical protein